MADKPRRWSPAGRDSVYHELDHPADLHLQVWGTDLPTLFENALFALYDQLAELEGFADERVETIEVRQATPGDALRALLSEALYRFSTAGFVAARADIEVRTAGDEYVEVVAGLHGETVDPTRHTLLSEIKAVTYHGLSVEPADDGGWVATVLLDV